MTTQTAHQTAAIQTPPPPADERIWDNAPWIESRPRRLAIAIPTYRDDAVPMIEALSACARFEEAEIVLFDDGAGDAELLSAFIAVSERIACPMRVVSARTNAGRAAARNRLIAHARADWLLLLDADMLPDSADFLSIYLDCIEGAEPGLFVGGFSLNQAPLDNAYALHRWQAARSECLSAATRNQDPGRFVYTSNVLAHRRVLAEIAFDEGFSGWGWEDVDWGLRVAREAPVVHLDNPATHMGLDADDVLMRKYRNSGVNFAYALKKHPEHLGPSPLGRHASRLARWPKALRTAMRLSAGGAARMAFLPISLRGAGLKLWRALVYAEALS